jgi:bifunctional DNase/RNase
LTFIADNDPIRCTIQGVFVALNDTGASPAVILGLDGDACLPIYIGLWEAISINNALNRELSPRPLTHDLFVELLGTFGIKLMSLYIDTLEEGIYYATLSLMREDQEETLDCRPSDGIALALRYGADIIIDPRVAEGSSVKKSDLPELVDLNTYFFG